MSLACDTILNITQEVFYLYPHRLQLFHSPQHSWGIRLFIYGWENGQSQPDADTLLLLCEIYQIDDILGTFGYSKTDNIRLTAYEKKVITALRNHPEMAPAIDKLLDL